MKETNQNNSDYSFIEEKIKERPLNKKKLIRKSILTAGAALIFGIVACITFLCLEPVFSKIISPKDEVELEQVVITEIVDEQPEELPEVVIEEMPIEDMMLEDETEGIVINGSTSDPVQQVIENATPTTIVETVSLELADYQLLYRKMYALAYEVQKSIVTVTGVKSDVDWMNSSYQSSAQTTGVIVGDNGKELLILADSKNIKNANALQVTFCDGTELEAKLKRTDGSTGLAIYGVELVTIPAVTREAYRYASVGSSYSASLMGSAVIALGFPTGVSSSVCYGAITSSSLMVSVPDANYQMLTTDIYGSTNANGVLINMRGQVIGFICQDYNSDEMKNIVYAYGISSIRKLVENLSNDVETPYLGLFLTDVTEQVEQDYGIPSGAYITKLGLNSPVMNVGVSSGDVIVEMAGKEIHSVSDYMAVLSELEEDQTIVMVLKRYAGDEYRDFSVEVKLSGND